jgi:ABC-type polysaccharide/polyol phosphate export permease
MGAVVWLGIYHDIAWTTPIGGLILMSVAPIASAMTTSIIYWLGASQAGSFDPTRVAFVLVGAVLYTHIAAYAYAPTLAIAEGKNLSIFPHVYITPRSSELYLAGRTMASFLISFTTSIIALTVAYFVLSNVLHTAIPLIVTPLSVSLLVVALILNVPAALGLGYMLGAYSLFASKFEWALPSYVAGILMVFSGALFPPSILPWPLSAFGNALPYTQFISAARDAVITGSLSSYISAISYSFVSGLVLLGVGLVIYRASTKKARGDGVIDRRLA